MASPGRAGLAGRGRAAAAVPVPRPEMVRAGLAIRVPLSAWLAVGRGTLGVLPAMGGLPGTMAGTGGPCPNRVKQVCGATGLVGLAGFEPATSATQTRRASQTALQPVRAECSGKCVMFAVRTAACGNGVKPPSGIGHAANNELVLSQMQLGSR